MTQHTALEDLIRQGRARPAVPARIGRRDVLVEPGPMGTSVYQLRGERVPAVRGDKGYRNGIVAALLDAVDDLTAATHSPAVG